MFTEEFFGVNGLTSKPSRESVVEPINGQTADSSTLQQTTPDVATDVVSSEEPTFTTEQVTSLIDTVRGDDQPQQLDLSSIPPRTVIIQTETTSAPVPSTTGIPGVGFGGGSGGEEFVEEDVNATTERVAKPNRLKQVIIILLVGVVAYIAYKKFVSKK